jgi:hypothetical protein
MDDADLSEPKIEAAIEEGIKHSRWMLSKGLIPCGVCFYCGSGVHAGELYCDTGCRDDHELQMKMKRINGR